MKTAPTASTVRTVRYALLSGLALFLAVDWYLRTYGGLPAAEPGAPASLIGTIAGGMQLAALAAIFVIRKRLENVEDGPSRFTLILVASAFCEAGALVGTVSHLIGGPVTLALSGLVIFGISMLWLPFERS
jgi:hypothetical protein